MTNKKNLLKGGLRKPVKKPLPDFEVSNKVTEKVHQEKEFKLSLDSKSIKTKVQVPSTRSTNKSKRTSIDFPFDVYVAIKKESFQKGITFREYVLDAVKKSLNM